LTLFWETVFSRHAGNKWFTEMCVPDSLARKAAPHLDTIKHYNTHIYWTGFPVQGRNTHLFWRKYIMKSGARVGDWQGQKALQIRKQGETQYTFSSCKRLDAVFFNTPFRKKKRERVRCRYTHNGMGYFNITGISTPASNANDAIFCILYSRSCFITQNQHQLLIRIRKFNMHTHSLI
jgi:uncharacterized ParB-like nuclease family protein